MGEKIQEMFNQGTNEPVLKAREFTEEEKADFLQMIENADRSMFRPVPVPPDAYQYHCCQCSIGIGCCGNCSIYKEDLKDDKG